MELATTITEIRKKNDLTQEEFAGKLFVTRQAVSRWENGETTPTVDTLKTISELFRVDANVFFGADPVFCQSCGMPLGRLEDFGSNADKGINGDFCTYCYQEGGFTHDETMEEAVEHNLQFLDEFNKGGGTNYTPDEARKIMLQFFPTLKRWKKARGVRDAESDNQT